MPSTVVGDSILARFAGCVQRQGDATALLLPRDAGIEQLTWSQVAEDAYRWTAALAQLGVRNGQRVAQWSHNRYEWILVDLALQALHAVHVPLHGTVSGRQAADQITHCSAWLVIIGDRDQARQLAPRLSAMPAGLSFVAHERLELPRIGAVPLLSEVAQRCNVDYGRRLWESGLAGEPANGVTTILYTSGTTGTPKGVALTHRNLVSNAVATVEAFGQQPTDRRLCFLPLSHIFARTCDLYTWIVRGSELALARSRDTIIADCKLVQPSLINGVPYFFERVHRRLIEAGVADEPGSLHAVLGGKVRACCSGGAALANETFDFFQQHDLPLLQGYGLTETSPVISLSTPTACRRGSVGKPVADVEVRIAADGEILTRGPHVMQGFWRDHQGTIELIRDTWLHTGDLGRLDDDGFLYITGRKTEMLVTATGKNIFPAHVEGLLCRDPLIMQALVVGDGRDYLAALIVPEESELRAEIKRRRLWVWSKRRAVTHPRILELYAERIAAQLSDLATYEQVQQFVILPRGFTLEEGHVTPKASLCREVIYRDFAREIDSMY